MPQSPTKPAAMSLSTALIFFPAALIGILLPGLLIVRLPLVPNWPYVGWISAGLSVLVGAVYLFCARHRFPRKPPLAASQIPWVFPFMLAVGCFIMSINLALLEPDLSLEFPEGRVTEKFRTPQNHDYPALRVEVPGRGLLTWENIPLETWNQLTIGSRIAKPCGTTDVTPLSK
jgi:hypothetical protein